MRPTLFLDVDGVLNSVGWRASAQPKDTNILVPALDFWYRSLDPAAVARLNGLLIRAGAQVVVSSSWRTMLTPGELREVLARRGFTGEIVGRTPDLGAARWFEILAWLDANTAEGAGPPPFVALDDDPLHREGADRRHFVRVDLTVGLVDRDVERALTLFEVQGVTCR